MPETAVLSGGAAHVVDNRGAVHRVVILVPSRPFALMSWVPLPMAERVVALERCGRQGDDLRVVPRSAEGL